MSLFLLLWKYRVFSYAHLYHCISICDISFTLSYAFWHQVVMPMPVLYIIDFRKLNIVDYEFDNISPD